jgi:hypothetical protein
LFVEGFYYKIDTDYKCISPKSDVFISTNTHFYYKPKNDNLSLDRLIEITQEEFDFVESCYNEKSYLRVTNDLKLKTDKYESNRTTETNS